MALALFRIHAEEAPAPQESPVQEVRPLMGDEVIKDLRRAYEKGEYLPFLENMHERYQQAKKEGIFNGFFERWAKSNPSKNDQLEKINKKLGELEMQRRSRLLEASALEPDSILARKAQSVAAFSLNEAQEAGLRHIRSLHWKFPSGETAALEKRLSEIAAEFHCKRLLLDLVSVKKGPIKDKRAKKQILAMERNRQILEAMKEAPRDAFTEQIDQALRIYDAYQAYTIDLAHLEAGELSEKR